MRNTMGTVYNTSRSQQGNNKYFHSTQMHFDPSRCPHTMHNTKNNFRFDCSLHFVSRLEKQAPKHLPKRKGLDVMQSHPLRRTRFGQYQASSAVLGWPGDEDCYRMHKCSQLAGPYPKGH